MNEDQVWAIDGTIYLYTLIKINDQIYQLDNNNTYFSLGYFFFFFKKKGGRERGITQTILLRSRLIRELIYVTSYNAHYSKAVFYIWHTQACSFFLNHSWNMLKMRYCYRK